jgi:hypothetical protein
VSTCRTTDSCAKPKYTILNLDVHDEISPFHQIKYAIFFHIYRGSISKRSLHIIQFQNKIRLKLLLVYQGLHMSGLAACGAGWARWLRFGDWSPARGPKLDLRFMSLCWIWGRAMELWAQQLLQVGVMGAEEDCWMNWLTRWHAPWSMLVWGSRADTRSRHAL